MGGVFFQEGVNVFVGVFFYYVVGYDIVCVSVGVGKWYLLLLVKYCFVVVDGGGAF